VCSLVVGIAIRLNQLYQWLESNHDDTDVVKSVAPSRCVQDLVDSEPNDLVHRLVLVPDVVSDDCPDDVVHVLSRKLVENAIRASEHVVQLLATLLLVVYIRIAYYNLGVAT